MLNFHLKTFCAVLCIKKQSQGFKPVKSTVPYGLSYMYVCHNHLRKASKTRCPYSVGLFCFVKPFYLYFTWGH